MTTNFPLPTADMSVPEHCLFIRMCAKQYGYSVRASFNDYLVENEALHGEDKLIADIRLALSTTIWDQEYDLMKKEYIVIPSDDGDYVVHTGGVVEGTE